MKRERTVVTRIYLERNEEAIAQRVKEQILWSIEHLEAQEFIDMENYNTEFDRDVVEDIIKEYERKAETYNDEFDNWESEWEWGGIDEDNVNEDGTIDLVVNQPTIEEFEKYFTVELPKRKLRVI